MVKRNIVFILIVLVNFSFINASTNNTFSAIGDSITAGGFDIHDRYSYYVAQNLSLTELNAGISGSCLTSFGSCSTQNPVINRINNDIFQYYPKYIYYFPNINDINTNNNVPILTYKNGLNNLFNNIQVNNSEAIVLTGSLTTYPYVALFPMNKNMLIGAEVREQAIIRSLPFVEVSYLMNFNSSIIASTCHPNDEGQQQIAAEITNAVNTPSAYTMTRDNFNVYHTCSDTIQILNYTFTMDSANCNTGSGSIDWLVIKNITNNTLYIKRLDEDLELNISKVYGINTSIDVYFSNSTTKNYLIGDDGILTLNIEATTDLTINFIEPPIKINNRVKIDAESNTVSFEFSTGGQCASYNSSNIVNFLDLTWGSC
jgi:hypothetical protein